LEDLKNQQFFLLRKPIALLSKMKKMKILKISENLRYGTLIPTSGVSPWPQSFFHIFGGFEKSAIFF